MYVYACIDMYIIMTFATLEGPAGAPAGLLSAPARDPEGAPPGAPV